MYIIVGLGNSGEEYAHTRHNTGRMASDFICNKVRGIKVFTPNTYMNKSGPAVAKAMAGKSAKKLVVIYDDLDLPLGTMKISYNRSSGGHKGLESVIRALKTEEFIRIRIGISPKTYSGKLKKPSGEKAVEKHILGEFKKSEIEILEKAFKRAHGAVETIIKQGLTHAMTKFNRV
ncbi:MAG: aminoacyl-tRNA hydrolase [Patescibacteria group bacterium]|nr:aminoacyl-tRNA hydrolase [Patescibacteria group bacterium]